MQFQVSRMYTYKPLRKHSYHICIQLSHGITGTVKTCLKQNKICNYTLATRQLFSYTLFVYVYDHNII